MGDILVAPRSSYRRGEQVRVVFIGAHPNNRLRRGDSYLAVEHHMDGAWKRMADDGDWSTKLHWTGRKGSVSEITITWDIPDSVAPGEYRIRYTGDARLDADKGDLSEVDAATGPFTVE